MLSVQASADETASFIAVILHSFAITSRQGLEKATVLAVSLHHTERPVP